MELAPGESGEATINGYGLLCYFGEWCEDYSGSEYVTVTGPGGGCGEGCGGSTVFGTVFIDNNANGVFDGGDSALTGTTVYLTDQADTIVHGTYSTGPVGDYQFNGLGEGTWRVRHNVPSGYVRTTDDSVPLLNDANWILSTVETRIEQVLKPTTKMPLAVGGSLVFDENGGTVVVGATRIDAVNPLGRPIAAQTRYLLFGAVGSYLPSMRDGFHVDPETTYEVVGGRLRRIRTYEAERDEIEELPLQEVLNRIVFAVESVQRR